MILKYEQFLNERFLNLFLSKETDQKIFFENWTTINNILKLSYAEIGGYKKGNYTMKSFFEDCFFIKLVRHENKIVAFRAYKDKHGRKSIAAGTDGSIAGIKGIRKIYEEDMKYLRSWGEVSGKVEKNLIKHYGGEYLPNTLVSELINKDIKLHADGIHYQRKIGGKDVIKAVIVGSSADFIKIVGLK